MDCARHGPGVLQRPDFDLDHAVAGTLALVPTPEMQTLLERDYDAMAMMITGAAPPFADGMAAIAALEQQINTTR